MDNKYLGGLLAGMLALGVLHGSSGEQGNNDQTPVHKKEDGKKSPKIKRAELDTKGKLDPYSALIAAQYMDSESIKTLQEVNSKYGAEPSEERNIQNLGKLFNQLNQNPEPITQKNKHLFSEIQTQQIFDEKDHIIPGMTRYIITYPVDELEMEDWIEKLGEKVKIVFNYVKFKRSSLDNSGHIQQEQNYPFIVIKHYILDGEICYPDYERIKTAEYGNKIFFSFVFSVPWNKVEDLQMDPQVVQFDTYDGQTIKTLSSHKILTIASFCRISEFSVPNLDIFCTLEVLCDKNLENSTCKNFYGINLEKMRLSHKQISNKFTANVGYFPFLNSRVRINDIFYIASFQKIYIPYFCKYKRWNLVWMGGDKYRYLTQHVENKGIICKGKTYIMDDDSEKEKLSPEELKAITEKIEEIKSNSIEVVFYTKEQIQAIKQQRTLFYDFIRYNFLERYMQYINLESPKQVLQYKHEEPVDATEEDMEYYLPIDFDEKAENLTQYEWDNCVLPLKHEAEKLMAVMRCEELPAENFHNDDGLNQQIAAAIDLSKVNEEVIANELAERGFTIQNVTGDGNCGIYALLAGLNPTNAASYAHVLRNSPELRAAISLRQVLFENSNDDLIQMGRWLALDDVNTLQAVNHYLMTQGRTSLIIFDTTVTVESGVAFSLVNANGERQFFNTLEEVLQAGGNNPLMLVYTPNHWKAVIPTGNK